jgi:bacteriocin-like protein
MKKLESLQNFELTNNQLANVNGGIGGPAPSKATIAIDFTGGGVLDYQPGNSLSYDSDINWGGGAITYINVNNIG